MVSPCITVFEACSAFTRVVACVLAKSPSDPLHQRLQPFRYLHDCSDCFRPERKRPGGVRTRWKSADFARRTSNFGSRVSYAFPLSHMPPPPYPYPRDAERKKLMSQGVLPKRLPLAGFKLIPTEPSIGEFALFLDDYTRHQFEPHSLYRWIWLHSKCI